MTKRHHAGVKVKCTICGEEKPYTKEHFWGDSRPRKNIIPPYKEGERLKMQCKYCINKARREKRKLDRASRKYCPDNELKKILRTTQMTKEIAETKRLQLILKDRAKHNIGNHLIFRSKGMYCLRCHQQQKILYPIGIEYLSSLIELFKVAHSHEHSTKY